MKRALGLALFFSVFFHLVLVTTLALWPVSPPESRERIEVEIVRAPERDSKIKNSQQIVREALIPDKLKVQESEDPIHFLSNQTQRVRKQTRAAKIGMTENRSAQASKNSPQEQNSARPKKDLARALDRDDLIAAAEEAARGSQMPSVNAAGVSTVGENLPESMEIGSFTALNTDRYLYYSFYSRVEGLIRFRWETAVQHAMENTPRERLAANIRNRWVTHMEILLNPHGNFLKVMVLKQSGLPAFDEAAALAFAQARYFPNPPAEMVEEDGMIHLKYSFTVYTDPRAVAHP